jgi:hypothetical protein
MFIPLRIRLLHNFGRTSFIIGFLFGLIGLVLVLLFSSRLNWKLLLAGRNDFIQANAVITESVETDYSANNQSLYEFHYRYLPEGEIPQYGSFLEYTGTYRVGQEIRIEYLADSPGISRFSGTDRRNFDQIMFLAGIVCLLAGFLFLYPSIRKTHRERKILMLGLPAKGRLIHAEPTNLKVNEQTVYKLTYEYPTGPNKSQKFSLRSHLIRNLSEEHFENLVYDPRKPSSAVIIDTLPGPVARYVTRILYPGRT